MCIAASEFDPLLDDAVEMVARLARHGRRNADDVRFKVFRGMPHGFLCLVGAGAEVKEANDECVRWLRDLLDLDLAKGTGSLASSATATPASSVPPSPCNQSHLGRD